MFSNIIALGAAQVAQKLMRNKSTDLLSNSADYIHSICREIAFNVTLEPC